MTSCVTISTLEFNDLGKLGMSKEHKIFPGKVEVLRVTVQPCVNRVEKTRFLH